MSASISADVGGGSATKVSLAAPSTPSLHPSFPSLLTRGHEQPVEQQAVRVRSPSDSRLCNTYGTSEGLPAYLRLAGEVTMGESPAFAVESGACARMGIGGMLSAGANAVVMVEHTGELEDETVEVVQPVAPDGHMLGPTDGAATGQVLLLAGQRLRPQDLGLLAAIAQSTVSAITRPRAGIPSTGDEVVPIDADPRPGQVRDDNTPPSPFSTRRRAASRFHLRLDRDDASRPREAVVGTRARGDPVLLSGGSSMGTRDLTVEVFQSFEDVDLLVHGFSVKPGNPILLVRAGECQLLGLPGQVASSMIVFHLLVEPILERLLGREAGAFARFGRQRATLASSSPRRRAGRSSCEWGSCARATTRTTPRATTRPVTRATACSRSRVTILAISRATSDSTSRSSASPG